MIDFEVAVNAISFTNNIKKCSSLENSRELNKLDETIMYAPNEKDKNIATTRDKRMIWHR